MEKILINKYGEAVSFNTEANVITPVLEDLNCNVYKAAKDGQVITAYEVIDVREGEFILTSSLWMDDKNELKVIVLSDPAAIHDLGEWYDAKLSKQKKNESC